MVSEGKPYQSPKSGLLDHISVIMPSSDVFKPGAKVGLVVDLSVVVRTHAAVMGRKDQCFNDFVKSVLKNIATLGSTVAADRIDIVADHYDSHSVKSSTREKRGSGQRIIFTGDSKVPMDFASFLTNDENKMDLNLLIAQCAT